MNDRNHRNEMSIRFDSYSANEAFARVAVAAFLADLDPTLDELADVKTAVSEAVTNSIIHGYENRIGKIYLTCAKEKSRSRSKSSIMAKASRMCQKQKNRFIRHGRNWNVPAWGSRLWKRLWTT